MKSLLTLLCSLAVVACLGQASAGNIVFASRYIAIPSDCSSSASQVVCQDGTSLSWNYQQTEKAAAETLESIAKESAQFMKSSVHTRISCYILDKEVSGYSIDYETREGHKGYRIIVKGVIEGKPMLIELWSVEKIRNNKDIPAAFRQIIRMKS